jgi:hypothetical protein
VTSAHVLDAALDQHGDTPGTVHAHTPDGSHVQLDVQRVGPIGVRIDAVRVQHPCPRPPDVEARRLAAAVRPGGEPLDVSEVDPVLGGAVLRTRLDAVRRRTFTEVTVTSDDTSLRQHTVAHDGTRQAVHLDLTRDQLAELIDGLTDTR